LCETTKGAAISVLSTEDSEVSDREIAGTEAAYWPREKDMSAGTSPNTAGHRRGIARRSRTRARLARGRDTRDPAADRLTAAAEHELVLAAKSGGEPERDELVEAFVPLIGSVARIYRGRSQIDRIELMQEGVVGLLRALERFDPARGTPFWMYASWWVRQAMQQLVSELARPIVLSDRALRKLARIRHAQRELLQRDGREPGPCDIAQATGLPREQVERLIAVERNPRALEEPVGGDHDAGTTLGELLDDPRATEAFERIPRRVDVEQLPRMLAVLSDRERTVIAARFGLEGCERTLRELGEDLGVSAERVRQIEEASLGKLRLALL
jgi:RNA polymerase primary sigma factor